MKCDWLDVYALWGLTLALEYTVSDVVMDFSIFFFFSSKDIFSVFDSSYGVPFCIFREGFAFEMAHFDSGQCLVLMQ